MCAGQTGSFLSMAPEVVLKQPYNEKADIFSLSCCMLEVRCSRPHSLLGSCPSPVKLVGSCSNAHSGAITCWPLHFVSQKYTVHWHADPGYLSRSD